MRTLLDNVVNTSVNVFVNVLLLTLTLILTLTFNGIVRAILPVTLFVRAHAD